MKLDSLADFSDRLSPMLVKELRQGLRTRSFIAVFLTLQIVLGIILLSAGALATSDNAGQKISSTIFIFFSIAVIVVQPMRGIAALSSEIKGNTIDMLVLTRLSAWRVVTGKWAAIVSQSALILVTIIPYLILRYFFGGMNLVGEIMLLLLIFVTSATITAITVGLSASASAILRSILPMVALPIGAISLLGMIFSVGNSDLSEVCALDTKASRIFVPCYLAACAYTGFFFLSTGTSLIAPYAENHSTLRRILALVLTVIGAVICSFSFVDPMATPFVFGLIFAPVFAISLSEFAPLAPPTFQKFSQYGAFGKLVGIFLFPGWASGVFFCLLLSCIAAIPFIVNQRPNYAVDEPIIFALCFLGTLLFPAVIINGFRMKGAHRVSNYVLFGVASFIVPMLLMGLAETMSNKAFMWLFVWIPPVLLFMHGGRGFDNGDIFLAATVIDALLTLILLILARREYSLSMREVGKSIASVK